MVGFHMMHQGARQNVFAQTRAKGIGTLLMFAVRSIFADPPRVAREMKALADKGLVEKWLGEIDDPLGFLIHEGGASSMTEAAYRFARHEPGVDVVLFGTGDAAHLRNVASLMKPPLPAADRAKLVKLFGHLAEGVGLDGTRARARSADRGSAGLSPGGERPETSAYFRRFAASSIRLRSECCLTSTFDLKMPSSKATSTFFCSATRSGIMFASW